GGLYLPGLRGPTWWDLLGCRARQCSAECGLPCNGFCTGNGGCDACLAQACPASPLLASADATHLLACEVSSLSLGIGLDVGHCLPEHPEGAADYGTWHTCLVGQCDACALASLQPDFTCVDKVQRERPAGATAIDVDVQVIQDPLGTPAPNLTV